MTFKLSINTGFAVNRYSEPSEWIKVLRNDLNIEYAQLTADILNPSLTDKIIDTEIRKINYNLIKYNVKIHSFFTGAFTRVNHLAHPNKDIQKYWIEWFKRLIDIKYQLTR